MRVLVLTQLVVYPADAGPKIKTLRVIQHLAKSHEVIYCTFVRNQEDVRNAEKLQDICQRVYTIPLKRSKLSDIYFLASSLFANDSFILRRDDRASMRTAVQEILRDEHIDILHVDQLNMIRFVPADWQGSVVLDEHNAVWKVVERLYKGARNPVTRYFLRREVGVVRRLEGEACHRADIVLAVSEQDKQALQAVAGESVPINVVPIAVDVESLEDIWRARSPQTGRVLTIGTMFWPPNSEGVLWWLRTGYNRLLALYPNLTYDVVGARPPRSLQMLAGQYRGFKLHGYVADVRSFWTSASVLAVPLLSGGGIRVKILEAMAMGVPVVSTTVGCEGLDVRNGEHLLIADSPADFSDACASLLQNSELARRLAQNARELMLEKYDVKVVLQSLDLAYAQTSAKDPIHI